MKKFFLVLMILGLHLPKLPAQIQLSNAIHFASLSKADSLLSIPDTYTNNWSRFDIDSRVKKLNSTPKEQFENMRRQLREWTTEEKQLILQECKKIDQLIMENKFSIRFPDKIHFIKSGMADEGGAAGYTRGNCIVLKEDLALLNANNLQNLIIHELFHILTRHNKNFRRDLYRIIGFELMNEVAYPESIKAFKISNPDAPFKDSYIDLQKDGKKIQCMMILYSKREYSTGSFFDYIQIGLLKLKGENTKEADLKDGKPVIYTLNEVKGFFEQVGSNTGYIIDPEEALADNFIYAIQGKKELPSQWIVDNIIKFLREESKEK